MGQNINDDPVTALSYDHCVAGGARCQYPLIISARVLGARRSPGTRRSCTRSECARLLTPQLETEKIEQPSFFIAGTKDPVLQFGGGSWVAHMDRSLTDLRGKVFIEGAGHWVQMERPAEVNKTLLDFLKTIS